jgi:late competence protein required for DNA uptake (superfamily II DNA/RNA helicase)
MRCERCKNPIQGEAYEYRGERLCEDCYLEALNPPRACDPWAVYSAKKMLQGKDALKQLSPLQAKIVEYLRQRREARIDEVAAVLGIGETELRREFASLRHMEIVKATKRGDEVLLTLFERTR